MTKFQKEEPVIHLLYLITQKLLKPLMARLPRSDASTWKNGRPLKDTDMEDINLQLSTRKLKEMQGKLLCKLQAFSENKYSILNVFSNLL